MRRCIVTVVSIVVLVGFLVSEALGCSCAPEEQPSKAVTEKALAGAAAVFQGYPVDPER